MPTTKAIFLDRDGVLNREIGDYVFTPEKFEVLPGVPEALQKFKAAGYLLIVITNQGGIAKQIFGHHQFKEVMDILHKATGNIIDAVYYAPQHATKSKSLMPKPDSLMLEKAIAKFDINPSESWMIGDAERDLKAAAKVGVRSILIPTLKETESPFATHVCNSLLEATNFILKY